MKLKWREFVVLHIFNSMQFALLIDQKQHVHSDCSIVFHWYYLWSADWYHNCSRHPFYFSRNGMLFVLTCLSVSCLVLLFMVVSRFCKNGTDPRLVSVGSKTQTDRSLWSTLPRDGRTRGRGCAFGNAIHPLLRQWPLIAYRKLWRLYRSIALCRWHNIYGEG